MISTRQRGANRAATILAGVLGLALGAAPKTAAASSALDLYYQRAVMSDADVRCRLFSPEIASTLNAARAQARGAALRAGADGDAVQQAADRARAMANRSPCNSRDLATAAGRVRTAFDGYSRQTGPRMGRVRSARQAVTSPGRVRRSRRL